MKASEIKLAYTRKSSGIKIHSSQDAEKALRNYWDVDTMDFFESFVVMYLSKSHEILGIMKIADGCLDACLVDVRKIMQGALLTNSASIIIAHNHPSGNLKASGADYKLTEDIKKAGSILKIHLLDHLILTSQTYMSFADEGLI